MLPDPLHCSHDPRITSSATCLTPDQTISEATVISGAIKITNRYYGEQFVQVDKPDTSGSKPETVGTRAILPPVLHERGLKSILSLFRFWHSKKEHKMQFCSSFESS